MPRHIRSTPADLPARCSIVPPHIVEHLARVRAGDASSPAPVQRTALVDSTLREQRAARLRDAAALRTLGALNRPEPGEGDRVVYDDEHTHDFDVTLVRGEGDPPTRAENVNDAYTYAGATREYFREVLDRDSIDNHGMTLNVNVNFGTEFMNAFWDGTRIVVGNGDGEIFRGFANSPDVIGHEFGHGVVEHTAKLEYKGQSGALNESFADVFGTLVEQHLEGTDFESSNWLIGEEVMAQRLYGEALRSMAYPGAAYDDPLLGEDPQPYHMSGYYDGPKDNGGVHINSGIVNRAFYLTASELGSRAAGKVWYAGLQHLWPTATFTDAATVLSAQARLLARTGTAARQAAQVVRGAFREVGIE